MSNEERITYETREDIAYLSMNRPPVNAIDQAMVHAMHDALRKAGDDSAVRAIVIASALDGIFCGGMDLRMANAATVLEIHEYLYDFYIGTLDIQYSLTKPTIASINGPARGAGMTVAITCDVALAADDIDLAYPEIDVGQIPAIHYVHLPRQISRNKAFELLFGGKPISATEAHDLGLINQLAPRDQLASATHAMARSMIQDNRSAWIFTSAVAPISSAYAGDKSLSGGRTNRVLVQAWFQPLITHQPNRFLEDTFPALR